jgi:hypothetical protein
MVDPLRSPAKNGRSPAVARYKWSIPCGRPLQMVDPPAVARYKWVDPYTTI